MQSNTHSRKVVQTPAELAPFIDHTLLRADATQKEIERLCAEALRCKFKGVCVNSTYVERVATLLQGSGVLTVSVVGFPLGAMLSAAKAFETELAVKCGAQEIDTVIALGALKSGDFKHCEDDLCTVIRAAGGAPVKVIIETGLLSESEIVSACQISEAAGATFVKTATGFLGRGASIDDMRLMRATLSPRMQIKASGGIKSFAQACELIATGADRLGTSSGVALVSGNGVPANGY